MPRRDSTTTPTAPFTNPRVLSKFRVSRILIPGRANMRKPDLVVGSLRYPVARSSDPALTIMMMMCGLYSAGEYRPLLWSAFVAVVVL